MSKEPRDLNVWLGGRVVADLGVNRQRVAQLRYRGDYVAERGEGALGLSVPLPVSSRRFRGDLVEYWMESLLPEGETRTILEQYFGVRRGDGFALLAALGGTARELLRSCRLARTSWETSAHRHHSPPPK